MSEQLLEAGILLAVGMSVVFAFLTLLIGGIHSIAWLARTFPEPASVNNNAQYKNNHEQKAPYNNKNPAPTTLNPNLIAAITAAVHTHRREKK